MKLRPFELTLVVVFGSLFFLALILLRTHTTGPAEGVTNVGEITIWGTLPEVAFESVLKDVRTLDEGFAAVYYRYIPEDQFDDRFVTALADQTAPDIILLPHERLVAQRGRLQSFSYESLPLRDYKSAYIDGAEIFALSDGIYALPVLVDPLLLYWNRDTFGAAGMVGAPKTWEEIVAKTVPLLTVKDYNRTITKAAVAMGEYSNVTHAFPIISTLFLQGGSMLVTESGTQYTLRLNEAASQGGATQPFSNAVAFFTNFSNSNNTLYTWNRALRTDKEMFISEDLAMYFGMASEARDLASKNPNLNFDVAEVPQGENATIKRTYGTFYGLAIPRAGKNKNNAYLVAQRLVSRENSAKLAAAYGVAPVQRQLLSSGTDDMYARLAYQAAVYARGWLSPDQKQVNDIFTKMIDDVNANRRDVYAATNDAVGRLQLVY